VANFKGFIILKTQRIHYNLDFVILKALEYNTPFEFFITQNVYMFRKIEKWTFRSCKEFENFRRYMNVVVLKSSVTPWSSEEKMNMTAILIMFAQNLPSTEVCTTGFTGHLNLRHQMVNTSWISAIAYLDINLSLRDNELIRSVWNA
jgi:hypothetical protein